jgi:hypothetical protein
MMPSLVRVYDVSAFRTPIHGGRCPFVFTGHVLYRVVQELKILFRKKRVGRPVKNVWVHLSHKIDREK